MPSKYIDGPAMKHYTTKARWSEQIEDEVHDSTFAFTVFEPENEPYDTGLVDKRGLPIMAINRIGKIGFIQK